jgi:hypothetical protein
MRIGLSWTRLVQTWALVNAVMKLKGGQFHNSVRRTTHRYWGTAINVINKMSRLTDKG